MAFISDLGPWLKSTKNDFIVLIQQLKTLNTKVDTINSYIKNKFYIDFIIDSDELIDIESTPLLNYKSTNALEVKIKQIILHEEIDTSIKKIDLNVKFNPEITNTVFNIPKYLIPVNYLNKIKLNFFIDK